MNSPVEIIKEKLSIVDVISTYISVVQSGKNYKAKCPFHNEKTPSFFISPDRNAYYCFGCGAKGDIFSFVENFEGLDFLGALKLLASRAGVSLSDFKKDNSQKDNSIYYEIMEEATSYYQVMFDECAEARAYLRSRGISDGTIKLFRIGYAKDSWKSLSDYLIKKGYKKEDIEKVGLIKNKDNTSFYDRFRGRIMFPINDSSGRVIAFSGRTFLLSGQKPPEHEESKYLNSPDTPLFNKADVLFGIDKAKNFIRTRGYSIVVEGQIDLILSHQASFTNTVAVSGTAFNDDVNDSNSKINNLGLIRRLSENIIFAFDGDDAGVRAASRSALIALSLDMQVKIAILPEGKDPADIINDSSDQWKDIIKNSVNIVSFHLGRICKSTNDLRLRGKQLREIIFPFIFAVKSSIERSAYISLAHKETGLPERAIIEDFESYEKIHNINETKNEETKKEKVDDKKSRRDNVERKLFGIIFWQKKNGSFLEETNNLCDSFKKSIGEECFEEMLNLYEPFSDNLSFEAEMWYNNKTDDVIRDLKEITLNLEEEILNERKILLLNEINQKERSGDKEDLDKKVKDYQEIVERIESIKNYRSQ